LIDLGFALHWVSSRIIFLKARDHPPGRAVPQAWAGGRAALAIS